jgi:hypothetical protein
MLSEGGQIQIEICNELELCMAAGCDTALVCYIGLRYGYTMATHLQGN